MKKTIGLVALFAALTLAGCSGSEKTTVQPSEAAITVEPSTANIVIEPAPVEVIIINGEEEATPTELFAGIRDAYYIGDAGMLATVTMLDNKDINLFNFLFVIELFDGDIYYSEPNAEREDGRITVKDNFTFKKSGKYTISLFYYGDKDVQLTKQTFDL